MDFETWWKDCMSWTEYEPDPKEKALAQATWEAALVNSKLTPEGYVLVPIDAATELLKAVYGNPEITYSMIQAAQEEE